jgi:hypothetical protein
MSEYSDDIKKEAMKLLKIDPSDHVKIYEHLQRLQREKSDQKIVDAIYDCYKEEREDIEKLANKIKDKLYKYYPHLSVEEYIAKVNKYQKRYEFSNEKKKMVINAIFGDKRPFMHEYGKDMPYTQMSKTLGYKPQNYNYSTGKMVVQQEDMEYLNAIILLNNSTKNLHNQLKLQTFIYSFSETILQVTGVINRNTTDIYNCIHPVIAALFFPRIQYLEQRMIMASIADMVCKLKEGIPFQTMPEIDLYDDICRDPVDNQCTNSDSVFQNLLQRAKVQTLLWNEILNLRQGKYYNSNMITLMDALAACTKHNYAPDFTYVKDCGTIMRALFSAFSFRPINVVAMPEVSVYSNALPQINPCSVFTTIQMVNVIMDPMIDNSNSQINLAEYLESKPVLRQTGHRLVQIRQQKIQHCYDVLTFYVPRKQINPVVCLKNKPYSFTQIPITTAGFEKVNTRCVSVLDDTTTPGNVSAKTITVGEDVFDLQSCVVLETICPEIMDRQEVVAGCATVIHAKSDNSSEDCWLYYSPLGLLTSGIEPGDDESEKENMRKHTMAFGIKTFCPMTAFDASDDTSRGNLMDSVQKNGTLYIYVSTEQRLGGCNTLLHAPVA